MKRWLVNVSMEVEVELDETKFTPEFIEEFQESFYTFPAIEDHVQHLAELAARGLIDPLPRVIEGYGLAEEFKIRTGVLAWESTAALEVPWKER